MNMTREQGKVRTVPTLREVRKTAVNFTKHSEFQTADHSKIELHIII
jgi:hypothetical protein